MDKSNWCNKVITGRCIKRPEASNSRHLGPCTSWRMRVREKHVLDSEQQKDGSQEERPLQAFLAQG